MINKVIVLLISVINEAKFHAVHMKLTSSKSVIKETGLTYEKLVILNINLHQMKISAICTVQIKLHAFEFFSYSVIQ